jgi:hypothetical protein
MISRRIMEFPSFFFSAPKKDLKKKKKKKKKNAGGFLISLAPFPSYGTWPYVRVRGPSRGSCGAAGRVVKAVNWQERGYKRVKRGENWVKN